MNGVQFVEPLWLVAGAIACGALAWAWRRYDARQRAALAVFASPHLHAQLTTSLSAARRAWKRGLFLAAIAFLFVALARPQAGFRWEDVKRRGIEVILAVDTSRSMLTPDVKPDRLTRAKLAVQDFVSHLDGDGVGLVAFAGNAFLQSPVTLDYDAFNESLNALDTTIIPRGGTDIASAIRETEAALVNRSGTDKILILLTDGEDLEGHALEAARAAAKDGLKIYAVGIGSANGNLIPLPADQGGGFVKDDVGQFVKSHLDEAGLTALAEATGGLYAPLGPQGQGLEHIYQQALAPLTRHDLASRQQKIYTERFQWPLAASLALLLLSMLVGTRRRDARAIATPAHRAAHVLQSAAAIVATVLLLPLPARASSATAEKAYKKGDYAAAQKAYAAAAERDPKQPDLEFNVGAAAFKAGQFEEAAKAFQKALGSEPSGDARQLAAQQDAYYNLGNTLYRSGQKTEQSNPEQTIQTWQQAVKTYDAALQLRANDADAKFNRDFVQRKLDALKKQQQNSQNQEKNQKQNEEQDQKDKNQQDQKSGQQDQQQPNGGSKSDQQKQQGQQQPQAGLQGRQPQPANSQPRGNAQGQTGPDQKKDASAQAAADALRQPGQMSKEEARNLLDSLKNEERRLPAAPSARSGEASHQPDTPFRNW